MASKVSNEKVPCTVYNKPVGYCTPVCNHNVGRVEARKFRKNFVV